VALASIITSGLAIPLLFCFCLGLPMCFAGIIMGFVARKRIHESDGKLTGEGVSTAAIILGAVGIAIFVLFALSFVVSDRGRSTL
jgi:hypothetical protein